MSQLKIKPTILKFKGQKTQKTVLQPERRTHSELVAEDNKSPRKSDSPVKEDSKSPTKKLKVETPLPVSIKKDKTAAQMAYEVVRKKRIMERIDDKMKMTHRQKLEKYNKKLNKQPEHYDIHKIGQKIQKGY